jgi:hypothetical protein
MSITPTATIADTLGHVMSDIEKFLDFMSILRLSRTCHSLQDALVDTTTTTTTTTSSESGRAKRLLKVSYFDLTDASLLRRAFSLGVDPSTNGYGNDEPSGVYTSKAYHAVTKLHYSSLKRLVLKPPVPNVTQRLEDLAFRHVAMNIGEASQLEEFDVDVGMVIMNDFKYSTERDMVDTMEESGSRGAPNDDDSNCHNPSTAQKTVYDLFACNLAQCKKLKCIRIINHFKDHNKELTTTSLSRFSFYGIGFLRAVTPMIQAHALFGNQGGLEEVTISLGNSPAPPRRDSIGTATAAAGGSVESSMLAYPSWRLHAALDFFTALLTLHKLRVFNLQFDLANSTLLNDFLRAAEHVYHQFKYHPSSEVLEKVVVTGVLYKILEGARNPLPPSRSISPFLALMGSSSNLNTFMVRLPPSCWDNNGLSSVQNLLQNKPRLFHLGLYFHDCECTSSSSAKSLLECILKYLKEREGKYNLISLSCLKFSNDADALCWEESLEGYHCSKGMQCLSEDEYGFKFQVVGCLVQWE